MSSKKSNEAIGTLRIISECPVNLTELEAVAGILSELLNPIEVSLRDGIREFEKSVSDEVVSEFIGQRIVDPASRDERAEDSYMLRDFEERVLEGKARARGIPYEGGGLQKLYRRMLGGKLELLDTTVVITDRLIMTWSDDDLRYHARVVVFGFPCVVSMSGLIEAPARPKEYYLAKNALHSMGMSSIAEEALTEQFAGRYLEPGDERIPTVLRGYLLQCLFYAHMLEPFCENPDCVLFNAHWQEEMIRSQLSSGRLCKKHDEMLKGIRRGERVSWLTDK